MNDLQKKELEMLKIFIDVCNKLKINYFLVCGSALGAIKYKGFIPWDDDIDVGLFREDYEIFLKKAPHMLPSNLFIQNYMTDSAFPQIFSKIRNSETTYIEKSVAHLEMNHGIYIDIFPLDGYPEEKRIQKFFERRKTRYKRQLASVCNVERNLISLIMCTYNRLIGCYKRTEQIARKYDSMIKQYSVFDSKLICNHGNWQGKLEYALKDQYGQGTMTKFEGIDVRIPEKYDEYLTQKYGDWRADPPKEEQIGHHYYSVLDLHRPYTDYIK